MKRIGGLGHGRFTAVDQLLAHGRVGQLGAGQQRLGRFLGGLAVQAGLDVRVVGAEFLEHLLQAVDDQHLFQARVDRGGGEEAEAQRFELGGRGSRPGACRRASGSRPRSCTIGRAMLPRRMPGMRRKVNSLMRGFMLLDGAGDLVPGAGVLGLATRGWPSISLRNSASWAAFFSRMPAAFRPSYSPLETLRPFSMPKIMPAAWRACFRAPGRRISWPRPACASWI